MGKNGRGKSKKGDKEYDKLQKFFHENKKLKEEIARLEAIMKRVDKGSCLKCSEEKVPKKKEKPKKTNPCVKCPDGSLAILEYSKGSESWGFEKCDNCSYRSVGKKLG